MATQTYIFYSSDIHGSTYDSKAKFLFNEGNHKKVLAFLENNLADYFEGNHTRQYDSFNHICNMVKDGIPIQDAINTSNDICGYCRPVESIQNIQY